jgi:hypothetical protein
MIGWIGVRTALWQAEGVKGGVLPDGLSVLAGEPGGVPIIRSIVPAVRVGDGAHLPLPPTQTVVPSGRWPHVGLGHVAPTGPPASASRPLAMTALGPDAAHPGIEAFLLAETPMTSANLAAYPGGHPALAGAVDRRDRAAGVRWAGDAWVLVRSGSAAGNAGALPPTYGGTQAGAVLRYRLAPTSPRRPTAYLRVTAALNGSGEREAAVGLFARPLGALPVAIAAEGRVGRLSARAVARPAVMAFTEIAPIVLVENARAELFLQGGYVGGVGATPFIDGQLRIDHRVGRGDRLEFRTGAGTWGGAQRDAGRLDVGPTATIAIDAGPAVARLSLDWRFRVAGAAEPGSGPALTISAGF